MGLFDIDWDSLYANAKESVLNASQDLVAVGVPAIKAGLEQQAMNWLSEQAKDTNAELKQNVTTLLSRPSDPNSLGAQISSATTNATISHYAPLILLGVGGVLIFGMMLRR